MSSAISTLDWIFLVLSDGVPVLLLILTLRYKLSRTLKSLVVYLAFACFQALWMYCIGPVPQSYTEPGFYFYFYCYWIGAFTLAYLRLFIILEICKLVLQDYAAVKAFAWRVLLTVGAIMFSWTAFFAIRNAHHPGRLVLTFQQTTDLSFAVLLLTLMSLGVYYRIRIPPLYRYLLIGSCIYSAEQVVVTELLRITAKPTNSVFDFASRFTWLLMIGIWTWAVWRWARVPAQLPERIPQAVYDHLSPRVHDRLRDLNDRLAAFAES